MILSDGSPIPPSFPDEDESTDSARNPFSVRFVQPGGIPFFFEPEFISRIKRSHPDFYMRCFAESMLEKMDLSTWIGCRYLTDLFFQKDYRGQITGPHGSGKSTLCASLRTLLERNGLPVFSWTLHDQTRALPKEFYQELEAFLKTETKEIQGEEMENQTVPLLPTLSQKLPPSPRGILLLDGYEQLSLLNRLRLRRFCRKNRLGLLVTTHRRQAGLPLLCHLNPSFDTLDKIVDYLLDDSPKSPSREVLADLYHRHRTDFRTILFQLYDWFEGIHE